MTKDKTQPDELSLEQLQAEAEQIRTRINRFRLSLGRFFVEKQPLVDLMCVAAVAQEPLLLVGPPGTAKSDLVLKFKDALGIADIDYFEYMLTRFTEPSEIIGPIDINQLREGRYIRREQGKLPTARLGFLDEIFKSNSAILNILLTIINEKKFYQDGVPQPVRLRVLFAATNEVPEHGELGALKDRFVLKAESLSVQDEHFEELIDAGLQSEVNRALNQKPWIEGREDHPRLVERGEAADPDRRPADPALDHHPAALPRAQHRWPAHRWLPLRLPHRQLGAPPAIGMGPAVIQDQPPGVSFRDPPAGKPSA